MPLSGREIIDEILRNMLEGLEPLHTTTLAPATYRIYLNEADFNRLCGIFPRLVEEAKQALHGQIERLNRVPLLVRLASRVVPRRKPRQRYEPAAEEWLLTFCLDTENLRSGDILIDSELAVPSKQEYGAGARTKRISTSRIAGCATFRREYQDEAVEPVTTESRTPIEAPATEPPKPVYAYLRYVDDLGPHTCPVTKDELVIGRGGAARLVDVKLYTKRDVSREHLRIRRDPQTGQFYVRDLSTLGTTLDGASIPAGPVEAAEALLPAKGTIGLAGALFVEFEVASEP